MHHAFVVIILGWTMHADDSEFVWARLAKNKESSSSLSGLLVIETSLAELL